eukprot:5697793-Pyramimonas_sp.AAC.1
MQESGSDAMRAGGSRVFCKNVRSAPPHVRKGGPGGWPTRFRDWTHLRDQRVQDGDEVIAGDGAEETGSPGEGLQPGTQRGQHDACVDDGGEGPRHAGYQQLVIQQHVAPRRTANQEHLREGNILTVRTSASECKHRGGELTCGEGE